MEKEALWKIGYGLYALFTNNKKDNGCIVNSFIQLTSEPMTALLSVNKNNYSCEAIAESGVFNICVLSKSAPFELVKRFGFCSGRDTDKFEGFDYTERLENGVLSLTSYANAVLSLKVTKTVDMFTHKVFFADITDAKVLSKEESMTYAYYQSDVKPKPKAAATDKTVWRCKVCGYEYVGDKLPDDFVCPTCKHGAADFEKVSGSTADTAVKNDSTKTANIINTKDGNSKMKKWKCTICGEIVESDVRPDKCPLCKAPGEKFVEVVENEMTWATEHIIGVAKDVPAEIIDGLHANFNGECTEVGMYLAMSRAAAREGYPEIAEYWKTAAFEEAEHAAKFAELLGEVVSPSTAKNLAVRVEAENGATAGKFELAKKAKELGLDAIHDTVHEMAKDEARHGRAFAGLLKRYFGE